MCKASSESPAPRARFRSCDAAGQWRSSAVAHQPQTLGVAVGGEDVIADGLVVAPDRFLAQGGSTVDPRRRAELLAEVEALLVREEPIWNHDETIRNNIFASNRDAQVWGWWATADDRHWPAASHDRKRARGAGLSLEALHITFANNLYDPPPGQSPFRWGAEWNPNKSYTTLDDVRRELNLEQGGRIAGLVMADVLTRDLRVPRDSPALALGAYPKGDVPGVRLGISSLAPRRAAVTDEASPSRSALSGFRRTSSGGPASRWPWPARRTS